MRIFDMMDKGAGGQHTVYVTPGELDPSATLAEWFDPKTKNPLQLAVKFTAGEANVPDPLGRIMIAHNLARKTRPLLRAS